MESFFNTSFADVRVHVGHEAAAIGALAFTHGADLYFAPGQYDRDLLRNGWPFIKVCREFIERKKAADVEG
jgi:Domain of unknown function (DUF4157)